MLPLVCSNPACPGLLVVVRFRALHRFGFLGSCSPLSKDSPVVKLHCVGLQHFGEWCSSCFAEASERGVCPRLEVGGVSLFCAGFALALRSFSRLRLFVSEARLSGYCVREGGVKGVNPGCL